jgi:hypothetical protein
MKKLILALFIVLGVLASNTNLNAETRLGGGLYFGSQFNDLALEARGLFDINKEFRIQPDIKFFLASANVSFFTINTNVDYFFHRKDNMSIYALAGLNFGMYKAPSIPSESGLGINLGVGSDFNMGSWILAPELKLVLGAYNGIVLGASATFPL